MQYILGFLCWYMVYRIWVYNRDQQNKTPDIKDVLLYSGTPIESVIKIEGIIQSGKLWRIDLTMVDGSVMKMQVQP